MIPLVFLLAACTQDPPKEICAELNSAIDRNMFEIALSDVQGSDDKSAMQQSARAQENANRLSIILINTQQQAQNKCVPRLKSIDPSLYRDSATACYVATIDSKIAGFGGDAQKQSLAKQKVNESCDFSKWSIQAKK
ncbi:MAG TPA: hypothetical protein VEV15_09460 [Flavisolibacter sp.]|nr:hypothetical protein [Flavisolibacter sp.]